MTRGAGHRLRMIARRFALTLAGLAAFIALWYGAFVLVEGSTDFREWGKPAGLPSYAEPVGAEKVNEYVGPFAGGNGPNGRMIFYETTRSFEEIKLELVATLRERGWKFLALREGAVGARSPDGGLCVHYRDGQERGPFAAPDDKQKITVLVYSTCYFSPDCRFNDDSGPCVEH